MNTDMKKNYITPSAKFVILDPRDLIATSGPTFYMYEDEDSDITKYNL